MSTSTCCQHSGLANTRPGVGSAILLILRVALGGLFVFASIVKFQDIQQFGFAINAYQIIPADAKHAVTLFAFVLPWLELMTGLLLILGLWGRAASLLIALMMAAFTAAVASVILRELSITCGCFGKLKGPFGCEGPIGTCKLAENATLMAVAILLTLTGPGRLALDARRSSGIASPPQSPTPP